MGMGDEELDEASKSRRRILQAAAAAGVGAAVLGAPKVSVVPAYGLTNSVVTDQCFYFAWEDGNGGGANDFWSTTDTNADSTSGSGTNVTYTWNNLTSGGGSLVINVTGSPSSGGGANFSPTEPPGCILTVMSGTGGSPYSNAPTGCTAVGSALSGTYSAAGANGFPNTNTPGNIPTLYFVSFDLSC